MADNFLVNGFENYEITSHIPSILLALDRKRSLSNYKLKLNSESTIENMCSSEGILKVTQKSRSVCKAMMIHIFRANGKSY